MIEAVVSRPVQYLIHVSVLKLDSSSKPRATASASCKQELPIVCSIRSLPSGKTSVVKNDEAAFHLDSLETIRVS